MSPATDEMNALALAIQRGESDDWDALLEQLYAWLRPRIGPMVSSPTDVDECLQQTVIRVMGGISDWDPERAGFFSWSRMLATYTYKDMVRTRNRHQNHSAVLQFDDVHDDWRGFEELSRIEDAQLIRQTYLRLIADQDNQAERILAAVRDLVNDPDKPVTMTEIARRADLTESTARRALKRVQNVIQSLRANP